MFADLISLLETEVLIRAWQFLIVMAPIWVPLIFVSIFLSTWFSYKRRQWIRGEGYVLLEIKLPREVPRSPAAMEAVLEGIWEDVNGTITDIFLKGRVREWFSLEIVSIGGEVKFFIWAFKKWQKIVETRIYSEYPGAEVFEVDDYTLGVVYDPEVVKLSGVTTKLVKADPIPIKTYIDYELDKKTLKEHEEAVDPLMPVIEYLGSLKPGEQAWFQILIQGHRKETFGRDARLFIKRPFWRDGVKDAIKGIVKDEAYFKPKEGEGSTLYLTKVQNETIAAIERNAGKLAFETMVRVLYVAPIDIANKMSTAGLVGSMRQFGSQNLNGIRPAKFIPGLDYPWNDVLDIQKRQILRTYLEAFKRRSFFNVPLKHYKGKPYILSTEELATIFHFPGKAVSTPTLTRIPSKKAEAPSNLPV